MRLVDEKFGRSITYLNIVAVNKQLIRYLILVQIIVSSNENY